MNVFILDRNEGLAVFLEFLLGLIAVFSSFTEWALVISSSALYGLVLRLGASRVECSSLPHSLLLLLLSSMVSFSALCGCDHALGIIHARH